MNTRGQGRVYEQKGSPYWYVAYYAHGKEQRECARHVRTGEKLKMNEKNRQEAARFLRRRLGELAAEQHGGRGQRQEAKIKTALLLHGLRSGFGTD